MKIVDQSNPIPKYLQISAWLKEMIRTGRFEPGQRLPSEVALSKLCGVNRNTLRQAISELTTVGILRKEKGTGTFVSRPAPTEVKHRLDRIHSFRDVLTEAGVVEKTRILKKNIEKPDPAVSKALFLGASAKVIVVRRVRAGNGTPFIYEESHLPADMFAGILAMDLTGSMYKIITEHYHVVLARCMQTIRAVNLNKKIAKILDRPENSAGIFIESVTFDENSVPIEVLHSYHRGDKYRLEIQLGRYHAKADKIQLVSKQGWGR